MSSWIDRVTAGDPTTLAEYEIHCLKCEALAYKRYSLPFKDLPAEVQDMIWRDNLEQEDTTIHSPTTG